MVFMKICIPLWGLVLLLLPLLSLSSVQGTEYGQASDPGICICEEDMFRHPVLNRCVSIQNATCTIRSADGLPIRTCTEYASCWPQDSYAGDADRLTWTCHCDRDAHWNPVIGQCKLTGGSTRCNSDTYCDVLGLLKCEENECKCIGNRGMYFNQIQLRCISYQVGGPCVAQPPFGTPECDAARNLIFRPEFGTCGCKAGYENDGGNNCVPIS